MKIFILEDNANRVRFFRKKLAEHEVIVCDNVADAKLQLNESFEVIFFDHDLEGKAFVNSNNSNTGYQLAKWLSQQGWHFTQIVIHSLNPSGADNIYQEVKHLADDVRKVPYTQLLFSL